jgi:hypothetical protein
MECLDVRKYLSEYLDGELDKPRAVEQLPLDEAAAAPPASLRDDIDTHLESCQDCRRELELLKKTVDTLRALPKRSLPADIRLQLDRSIEREMLAAAAETTSRPEIAEPLPSAPARHSRWAYALSAAASVLIVVGLALHFYFASRAPRGLDGDTIARSIEKESPEMEDTLEAMREHGQDETAFIADDISSPMRVPDGTSYFAEEVAKSDVGFKASEPPQLGFSPRQSVEAGRPAGALEGRIEPESAPVITGIQLELADALQPPQALTLSNAIITPATANQELEAILTGNNWTNNLRRADNVYTVEIPAADIPALVNKLNQAKSFKPTTSEQNLFGLGRGAGDIDAVPQARDSLDAAALVDEDANGLVQTQSLLEEVSDRASIDKEDASRAEEKGLTLGAMLEAETVEERDKSVLKRERYSFDKQGLSELASPLQPLTGSQVARFRSYGGYAAFVVVNIVLGEPGLQKQPTQVLQRQEQAPQPPGQEVQQQAR